MLALEQQEPIDAALARLRAGRGERCLSELAFSNLYLFRAVHQHRHVPGPWPGVAGVGYDGARYFLPLFDVAGAPQAVLHRLLAEHGHLYPLDEGQATALAAQGLVTTASRDDADYLYPASQLAGYAGRALAKKRNQVRQLLAMCTPMALPYGQALEGAARQVLARWMVQKGKAGGAADEAACLEALALAGRLALAGFAHFDGGRPIGFVLGQWLEPGVVAIRFAKGLDAYPGIYPFMFQHFCLECERHFGREVRWLNFEQDMGNAGMRRSKMSFAPAALLPKWRASLRPGPP